MYWNLTMRREEPGVDRDQLSADGRFVLHRHRDSVGAHFDLRLEQGGALVGWRIDGESLEGSLFASEKASHPVRWLDVDGDAIREDVGEYCWVSRGRDAGSLRLIGEDGSWLVSADRVAGLSPSAVRSVSDALESAGFSDCEAGRLVVDGIAARQRAVERLCGLGRELDGSAFDEDVWRQVSRGLSLEEIHGQLRAYEVRFDVKYPPSPVSRPEALDGDESGDRAGMALAIARG
jgi:hypothetical protein